MSQRNSNTFLPGPGPTAMPIETAPERDNLRGLIWMLISVVGASLMTVAVRYAVQEMDTRLLIFYRATIVGALMMLAFLVVPAWRRKLRFSRPWLHIIRGGCIGFATHLGFYTLATVPLAAATVLMFTAPIFATLLGMFFHGEKIGPRRIAAIVCGFGGALIILRPGSGSLELGMLTGIGSSVLFAAALTMSRNLANADGPLSTYFSSVIAMALVSVPLALPVWDVPKEQVTWIAILALIITGATRGVADIQAYRLAEASVLAPISYLRLVIVGIAAYFLFAEVPDLATWIGATVIVGSTFYIARREATLRRANKV